MLFRRKPKTIPAITYPYGFSAAPQPETQLSNRVLICALKGLIIFAAACGTLGGVISSFSLPCYPATIFAILFILAMALSFMHYNRLIFNICYPLLFIIFTYCIFQFRYQVNSGYQAFLSIMQEYYSDYFDLSFLREGAESILNRNVTISFAAVFIGFFLMILLNIAVSEYMSLCLVLLLTFPIFQLGIYVEEMPDFHYLLLLLFSYFMVGILRRSGHHLLPHKDKRRTEFAYTDKKGQITHSYHSSGRVMFQLAGIFLAFSGLLGLLCLPMLLSASKNIVPSSIRRPADEYVKIFVQSGLSGFFNRYEATGGISEGRLGGVSSVRPDYETDLTITFVPFAYETLYLKAYTGSYYTGDAWEAPDYDQTYLKERFGSSFEEYEQFTATLESRRLKLYTDTHKDSGIYAKMKIDNLDANENCLYLPYYTYSIDDKDYFVDQSLIRGTFPTGTSYTLGYYPLLHDYWPINEAPDEMIEYYGFSHKYTQYIDYYNLFGADQFSTTAVPEALRQYLETLKPEIGYGENTDAQIALIQNYLSDNYTYDMSPGATPYRKDFIRYFLETQKRGYCAHFASAATMLLRSYGIRARYVEGYAVPFLRMAEGKAVDEDYSAWFMGKNPIEANGVISVDVTDADAHAWVEVYKSGIGWVPYEFTPPSTGYTDTENAYSDFWSLFSDLIRPSGAGFADDDGAAEVSEEITRINTLFGNTFLRPLLLFLAVIAAALISLYIGSRLYQFIRLRAAYRNGNYIPLLSRRYQKLCILLRKKGLAPQDMLLPTAFPVLPVNGDPQMPPAWDHGYLSAQMECLEKCCFSETGIKKTEADELLLFLKRYIRLLNRKKWK